MSRIDTVSDSGSSWNGSGLGTPTATFIGTPNAGQLGTFTPGFSGEVKLTGSGSGPIQTYDWTAKAKYELGGKFKIYLDFSQGDDFTGRSKTAMGIGEIADIQVVAFDPPGATVTITSVSTSGAITNGGLRITAGNTAGIGTITVWAKVGNSSTSTKETLNVSVLEPTGVRQIKLRDVSVPTGTCGAGFEAASYLEPKNVSFHFITVGEGICYSTATGSIYPSRHEMAHSRWTASVSKGNSVEGCRVEGPNAGNPPYDYIFGGEPNLSIGAGTFTWNIPWEYSCGNIVNREFSRLTHLTVYNGNGGATTSKAGNSSTNP
ncbi:MAG: hypothetical protein LBC20_10280 [Planctomycetaceae bacterium]|nr:hypothetical protein [Planctomycetaceae bacterium]